MGMGNGNGEWGMGNGEWGMGNGEWGMGNGEWGMGNGEWGMGNGEILPIPIPGFYRKRRCRPMAMITTAAPR
ncbi:hypothetical protein UN63_04825 [Oceanisphaera arctica]|uniref:Uncharacterized protein n=1 Tax=Oceanisphaera arctica TaxID=641510 RepID=A0A2P5TP20_9GAMM|nr:hypothetical protein UN63_04825 [Oceanisphaera arctica]